MAQKDPEAEETIARLDALPGAYVRVWEPRPAYEQALATVAVVALLACMFGFFLFLSVLSLTGVQVLAVVFGVTAVILSAAWIVERVVRPRFFVGHLRVPDAERDVLLGAIAGFLATGDQAAAGVEKKGILGRTRVFRIESLGAELAVTHQSRTGYEAAYWDLRLRYPVEKEAAVGAFLASFTRYAIGVGMISPRDWRIGEVLGERRDRVRVVEIGARR